MEFGFNRYTLTGRASLPAAFENGSFETCHAGRAGAHPYQRRSRTEASRRATPDAQERIPTNAVRERELRDGPRRRAGAHPYQRRSRTEASRRATPDAQERIPGVRLRQNAKLKTLNRPTATAVRSASWRLLDVYRENGHVTDFRDPAKIRIVPEQADILPRNLVQAVPRPDTSH